MAGGLLNPGAGRAQGLGLGLQSIDLTYEFVACIGQADGGHDDQPLVADLAELGAQGGDPAFKLGAKALKMGFLAIGASHPVGASSDGDRDLGQGSRLLFVGFSAAMIGLLGAFAKGGADRGAGALQPTLGLPMGEI